MCLRLGVGLCYPGITHRCQDWEPQSSPTLWTLESHSFLDLIVGLSVLTPESILLEFLYMERNLFRDLFFFILSSSKLEHKEKPVDGLGHLAPPSGPQFISPLPYLSKRGLTIPLSQTPSNTSPRHPG